MRRVDEKPLKRYELERTKERRKAFDRNIQEHGVFAKSVVHCMNPDLERYFRNKEVELIEIATSAVTLVMRDGSRVRVK